jgi:hypothetical protein
MDVMSDRRSPFVQGTASQVVPDQVRSDGVLRVWGLDHKPQTLNLQVALHAGCCVAYLQAVPDQVRSHILVIS